jgi:hypothetical protein
MVDFVRTALDKSINIQGHPKRIVAIDDDCSEQIYLAQRYLVLSNAAPQSNRPNRRKIQPLQFKEPELRKVRLLLCL